MEMVEVTAKLSRMLELGTAEVQTTEESAPLALVVAIATADADTLAPGVL